jgi:hypothetical protein
VKGDAVKLAALSAQIQNVAAASGVLKVARDQLLVADQAVQLIPAGYAVKDSFAAFFSSITGATAGVHDALRSRIAQARGFVDRYAAFYVGYEGDDLLQEISTAHSMGIASTCQDVNKVLNDCIDEIGDGPTVAAIDFVNAVEQVLIAVSQTVGKVADSIAQGAANVVASATTALWVPLLIAGSGVLLVVLWQKGLLGKVGA